MPRHGIVGAYSSSVFSFVSKFHTVLIVVVLIYSPPNNVGGFPFLHTAPAFLFVDLLMLFWLVGGATLF